MMNNKRGLDGLLVFLFLLVHLLIYLFLGGGKKRVGGDQKQYLVVC